MADQGRKRRAAARVSRRRHEAEDWAQARLLGVESGAMPENGAGLRYIAFRYPWLLSSSDNCSIPLPKTVNMEHKDAEDLARSERLKVLVSATNQRMGRLLEEQEAGKGKSPAKKVEIRANKTRSFPQASQQDSARVVNTIDTHGAFQRHIDTEIPNLVLSQTSRPLNSSANATDMVTHYGSPPTVLESREDEVKLKAISKSIPKMVNPLSRQVRRVLEKEKKRNNPQVIPPQKPRWKKPSQPLRATAPIFVPTASINDSGTSVDQTNFHVALSLTNITGSQLYNAASRPQTTSVTTTNTKVRPAKYLPKPTLVPQGQLDLKTNQKPAISNCHGPVAPVKIQTNLANITGWPEFGKYGQNIDMSQKIPRDYKDLAAWSDIDSIASENGEHIGNDFLVTEKTEKAKQKQALTAKFQRSVATASFFPPQPVNYQEPGFFGPYQQPGR